MVLFWQSSFCCLGGDRSVCFSKGLAAGRRCSHVSWRVLILASVFVVREASDGLLVVSSAAL